MPVAKLVTIFPGPEVASPLAKEADSGSFKQPVTHSPYDVNCKF